MGGMPCHHGAQCGSIWLQQAGKRRAAAVMGNRKHLRAAGQNECSLPPGHLSIPWMSGAHDSNAQAICGEKKVNAGTAVWDSRALLSSLQAVLKGGATIQCQAHSTPAATSKARPGTQHCPMAATSSERTAQRPAAARVRGLVPPLAGSPPATWVRC